jgi:hypothetical protein
LEAQNEAIKIMWLKAYLNFSLTHPMWAKITDLIIAATANATTVSQARKNPFLQAWRAVMRGERASQMNEDITRMLKTAKKYKANLAAIRLSPELRTHLPAWYHIASKPCPMTNRPSKCLLRHHEVTTVADIMRISARLRNGL